MTGERILIVEDDAILAMHLADILTGYGYRIDTPLATGEEAVEHVEIDPPDIILMDIRLPGEMNGIEATEAIKKIHDIPVVYLTAYSDPELINHAKLTEPYAYLVKPVPDVEVRTTIEMALYKHRVDMKLRESEEQYRSLFENANEGILIADSESTRFVSANPAICRMLGYSEEELLSMQVADIHPEEEQDRAKREFMALASGEKPMVKEIPFLCKDKTIHIMDISSSKVETGNKMLLIGFFTDVTERYRAEEALKKSEEQYRNLVENVSDVIYTMDCMGVITYISPIVEKLYGFTQEEVRGHHFSDFIHPDDLPGVVEGFNRRIKGEYGENVFRILAKDRTEHYVRTTQTPIYRDGGVIGFNYIMTDFTARRKAEDALREVNKKLNILSSITRHDILNQIMGIKGYLELSKDLVDDPKVMEYMEIENKAVEAIQRQIEFTRYYQDIGVEEPKWQDAEEIAEWVAKQLCLKGITVENSLKGLEIFADPLIEKVFYNLIENSIRHGRHVTAISFSYAEIDDNVVISYRDDGVGITEEDKSILFRRGFGKHTGLGLFLSSEILSITGITIQETGEPGKGVHFEITVPKGDYRFNDKIPE